MSEPPNETTVGTFEPKDQPAARRLILAGMQEHWGTLDPSMNRDLDDIAATYAGSTFLLAWSGEELVGTGALVRESEGVGRIVRMSVAAHARRRGVGRSILDRLLEKARDAGYGRVLLETEEDWGDAIAFYESCGFRITDRREGGVHLALDLY